MTGDYNSVIGMEKDEPLRRFTRRIPSGRFEPATGPATLCAVAVEHRPGWADKGHRAGPDRRASQRGRSRISGTERAMTAPTIVYDLDGTLADTAGDLMGALNFVLGARRPRAAAGRKRPLAARGRRAGADQARLRRLRAANCRRKSSSVCSATSSPITTPTSPSTPASIPASARRSTPSPRAGWRQAICTNKIEASAKILMDTARRRRPLRLHLRPGHVRGRQARPEAADRHGRGVGRRHGPRDHGRRLGDRHQDARAPPACR